MICLTRVASRPRGKTLMAKEQVSAKEVKLGPLTLYTVRS